MTTIIGTPVAAPTATRYATVAELKARLDIADVVDDTVLGKVLEGVSRSIDRYCGRRFYTTDEDETRYFTAEFGDLLLVGDMVSVTTLATDEDGDRTYERTWSATDYDLEPVNAALDGWPYREIWTAPLGAYAFPTTRRGVRVVGTWGWPAVPDDVREACLIQGARIFKRKDTPFGVMGSAEMGQLEVLPKLDPDVKLLLDAFRKMDVGGV